MTGADGRDAEGQGRRGSPGEGPSRVRLPLSLVYLTALTSPSPSFPQRTELCPDLRTVQLFGISMPLHVPLHLPGAPSPMVPALLAAPQAACSDAHPVGADLALLWAPLPPEPAGSAGSVTWRSVWWTWRGGAVRHPLSSPHGAGL